MPSGSEAAASLIIPAHNESSVIGRLLDSLPTHVGNRPLQVIVACNGCTDNTAEVARQHGAVVLEVQAASKIAALNAADSIAISFPRLYIDADIAITSRAVAALIEALSRPGALCAAPPPHMEISGRPWLVRAYLTFLRELSTMRGDIVGAGVYALSKAGRGRFGAFPDVIADDAFVRNLFSSHERQIVSTDPTIVQAPWSVHALFRQRVRGAMGNLQLAARARSLPTRSVSGAQVPWWRVVTVRPGFIPSALVYIGINALARIVAVTRLRGGHPVDWGRDHTTR